MDIPLDAVRAYHENVEAEITPTIEEGIAHILSQPQMQRVMVMLFVNSLRNEQIHTLFKGCHDEYDIDDDRMALRDLLLTKTTP